MWTCLTVLHSQKYETMLTPTIRWTNTLTNSCHKWNPFFQYFLERWSKLLWFTNCQGVQEAISTLVTIRQMGGNVRISIWCLIKRRFLVGPLQRRSSGYGYLQCWDADGSIQCSWSNGQSLIVWKDTLKVIKKTKKKLKKLVVTLTWPMSLRIRSPSASLSRATSTS